MNLHFCALSGAWLVLLLSGGGKSLPVWAVFAAVLTVCLFALRKGPRAGALLLWALWLAACCVFSVEPLNSFWHLSLWLLYFVSYVCAAAYGGEAERALFAKLLLWAAGLFSALIVVGNMFGADPAKLLLPPNQNYTAALIAAAFVGLVWALLNGTAGKARFCARAALLFLLGAALLEIKSRGAVLGAVAGFAYLCFYLDKKRLLAWTAGAVLLSALLAPSALDPLLKKHQRFRYERVNIWKTAALSALEKPLFGWGPGCFERAYLQKNFPAFNGFSYYNNYTGNAHSQLLQQAAETGVVGALFFLLFFLPKFRLRDKTRLPFAAMLLCLFFMALFDGIMALPLIAVTMFMLAAFAENGEEPAQDYDRRIILSALFFAALGLVLGTASQTLRAASVSAGQNRVEALNKLLIFYPQDDAPYAALADMALSPGAGADLLQRAVAQNPNNAVYRFRLAQAQTALGAPEQAEEQLRRSLELEPNFQRAALALASFRLSAGDSASAIILLERADASQRHFSGYKPQSGYEAELLAQDEERAGLLRAAVTAVKRGKKKRCDGGAGAYFGIITVWETDEKTFFSPAGPAI